MQGDLAILAEYLFHPPLPADQQEKPNLSFIKELAATRKLARQSSVFDEAEITVSPSPMTEEGPYVLGAIRALKTGNLTKTSQSVGGNKSNPGFSRHRRFRLTKEALEYFHTFNHVSSTKKALIGQSGKVWLGDISLC